MCHPVHANHNCGAGFQPASATLAGWKPAPQKAHAIALRPTDQYQSLMEVFHRVGYGYFVASVLREPSVTEHELRRVVDGLPTFVTLVLPGGELELATAKSWNISAQHLRN